MTTREIEEVTTVRRNKIVYICDRCGSEDLCSLETCFICGNDVCSKCRRYMPENKKMWHEYEHCCCNDCWDAGNAYRNAMDVEEYKFRKMFEKEILMWKKDAKGAKHERQ